MARSDWHHLYNTARWKQLRVAQLRAHPLCKMCFADGKVVPAMVADHVKPHKGDEALFFDAQNLQSLCKPHHDSTKKREEIHGVMIGCDEAGVPIDPRHHWAKG